jgi:DNA-directed DNA polymerase III PolC
MLNTHSHFSFRYGIVNPETIPDWAQEAGYAKIVLTDINNTAAVLSYVRAAQEAGFPACAGIDFRNGVEQQFVGIANNNTGYHELNEYLSEHLRNEQDFPARAPVFKNCQVIYPWKQTPADLRTNEWTGIRTDELNLLTVQAAQHDLSKMVVLQSMTFHRKRDFNVHRLLRAIDQNCLLSLLPPTQQAAASDLFLTRAALAQAFQHFPEILANTDRLLSSCSIEFQFGDQATPQNQACYTNSAAQDLELVRKLAYEGVAYRYSKLTDEIRARIEKEIQVIHQKDYLSYFLIAWDIVHYARSQGYFYVGRGSGANSLVAYLLRITDVDPLELDLYFERFINLYRKNPPDFDIDFSWRDRDDVTRYIFGKFEHAALLCTYHTFQRKAIVRELGKVFGLPSTEINRLIESKYRPQPSDEIASLILKYSQYIEGMPSHLSIHAGGIIISQQPVTWFSAVSMPPKGYPTTQFSMIEAEDVGLYKFDILSQRGLGKIKECLEIVAYNQPGNPPADIHHVQPFMHDTRIREMLQAGQALGCFYVESPAMRMLLLKLKVDSYLTLVAASSIIRPGVSNSGMMREYILRHLDTERRAQSHPVLMSVMPETYGIMVYQEDVIKVAHHFAGLNLAEADILRRGMTGKFRLRGEFQRVRDQYFNNCRALGRTDSDAAEVWRQIESFAGFSFSKGHSASYAVESYQSLYLKCYYPLEYLVATLNNGGGFYQPEMYVHEARMLGARIEAPSVNYGAYESSISGTTIYLGFVLVQGLEATSINRILAERHVNGPFTDLRDLMQRVHVPLEQLALIIRIGGLRDLSASNKPLLWQAHLYHTKKEKQVVPSLFETPLKSYELPVIADQPLEQAFEQLELLDFTLCNPFELLAQRPVPGQYVPVSTLPAHTDQFVQMLGYLVNVKKSTTARGQPMYFGTFLDESGQLIDTVHFPQSGAQFPFSGRGIYQLVGRVAVEFGFYTLEVSEMYKQKLQEDARFYDGMD